MSRVLSRIATIATFLLATLWSAVGPIHQAHAATTTVACSQTAVQAALNAGGSYAFAGDCTLTITPTLSAGNATTPTTLDGAGHAVVFDGNNATRILSVNEGVALTLVALTLRHGTSGGGNGGAIDNSGTLTVTASTLASNSAGNGDGGAVNNDGTATISGSTLSSNSGTYGGAVHNGTAGTVTISASTLASNVALYGGAVNNDGSATISASTLTSNFVRGGSAGFGGAVYNSDLGAVFINASTLSSNTASYGGAVYNDNSSVGSFNRNFTTVESGHQIAATVLIFASTLVSNTASSAGGAVFNNGSAGFRPGSVTLATLAINASTLVSNTSGLGGAVGGEDALGDTLVAGNGCDGDTLDGGHNLIYHAPGCPGSVSGKDPLLGPLANNGGPAQTLAVGPGSPAIGAGDPALCGPTVVFGLGVPGGIDQRGVARTLATCTIGAYEYQDPTLQTQTITFNALPNKTYGDSSFDVGSYASASSGLAVSFSSATTGVCAASGSTVTIVSAGTCTIDADQPGNTTYTKAPQVQRSLTVAKAGQAIGFGALSAQLSTAAPFTVGATGGASGNPVTFAAGPSTVCSAGGTNGSTITVVGVGTCTVTASQAGTTNYLAAPQVPQGFGVTAPQQSTTLGVATASGSYGGKADLSATIAAGTTPVSGETIVFSLNGAAVCGSPTPVTCPTTGASGVASLPGISLAGIDANTYATGVSARFAGDSGYLASSGSNTLTVSKANQAITVTIAAPPSRAYNGTFGVAAASDSGLTVAYGSDGGCTNSGTTYTMTSGTTACTATLDQAGNTNYNTATRVAETVAATKASQTITFDLSTLPAKTYGDATFSIGGDASASSGLTISFSSATTGVCTVSGGTVTIVSAGTCTIGTGQAGDTNYNNAPQAQQSRTIAKAPLTITASSPTVTYDGTVPAIAPSYGGLVNGDSAASLTAQPACTSTAPSGGAAGSYTTGCSGAVDANYAPIGYVGGTLTINPASQLISFGPLANHLLGDDPFRVSATVGGSGNPVTFSAGPTGVCAASGTDGQTITLVGVGTCTVIANQAGNANYTAASPVAQSLSAAYPPLYMALALTGSPSGPVTTGSTVTASLVLGNHTAVAQKVAGTTTLTYAGSHGTLRLSWPFTARLGAAQTISRSNKFAVAWWFPRGTYTLSVTAQDGSGDMASRSSSLTVR